MLPLRQHNQNQRIAITGRRYATGENSEKADQWMMPEPRQALFHFQPEMLWLHNTLILKFCLDKEKRYGRNGIRDGITQEGQHMREAIEKAANGRANHASSGIQHLVLTCGISKLLFGNNMWNG